MRTTEALVRGHARQRPTAIAVVAGDQRVGYAELDTMADQVGHGLLALGVRPGDRVSWLGRNAVGYAALHLGAERARAVLAPLNWRLAARELHEVIDDARPDVIVAQAEFLPLLLDALSAKQPTDHKPTVLGADGPHDLEDFRTWLGGQDTGPLVPETDPGDGEILYYTSGTSGRPKGVPHAAGRWNAALDVPTPWTWDENAVLLIVSPVFHIAGGDWVAYGLRLGATQVLLADARAETILATLTSERVTHAQLVPAVLQIMLAELRGGGHDLSALRLVAYGASPMPAALLREVKPIFGCEFNQVYGLTETNGVVTNLTPADHQRADRLASAGRPIPGTELMIAEPGTGLPRADGTVGEVWVRSDLLMTGYWNRPAQTAEAIDADGWFHTGDAGYLDGGYLYLTDRVSDRIVSGGENIYPAEIENVLAEHPDVGEVAVVGMPSERWGEAVRAVVVPRTGASLDPGEVIGFCRARLAGYKCPARVDIVEALPRNAAGKVLRRSLRDKAG